MKCLDSAFIIDFLRHKPNALKKAQEFGNEVLVTTYLNIFEVMQGELRIHPTPDEHFDKALELFNRLGILELNEQSALKAAEIGARLLRKGTQINTQDVIIAGITLSHGCTAIVTNDLDFEKVVELQREGY